MLVLVVLAMAGWLLLGGKPVAAANQLVSSIPEAGSTLDASPTTFQMTFKDPVGPQHVVALSCSGQPIQLGPPQLAADTVTLTVAVPTALPAGNCTVAWSVSQSDGTDGGSGKFDFTLKAGATAASTPPAVTAAPPIGDTTATTVAPAGATSESSTSSSSGVDGPLGLAKLLTNLGLAALFGALILIALAWPEGVEYILTVRFLRTACVVAIAGALLTVICLSAAATGDGIGASISPSAWMDLKDTTPGLAALARLVLTVGCAWVVMRPDRVIDPTTQLASLGIPGLAVATIGFNRVGGDMELVGVAVGVVHALAMAAWLGGIILLGRVVLAGPGDEDLVHAVRGFRRISMPAIIVTVVTGLIQTYRLDWGQLFDTSHGRVLLLKGLTVAAMVFVGLASREFIRTRMARVETMTVPLATRLQRAVGIEVVVGVLVLVLTAWLTSFVPPKAVVEAKPVADLGSKHELTNDQYSVRATVQVTERVGANAVMLTILSPKAGLQDVQLEFTPPIDTGGTGVIVHVPLTGAGSALLPRASNMPLDATGTWTVVLRINNVVIDSTSINVQPAEPTPGVGGGSTASP